MQSDQSFLCCNCLAIFYSTYYNWYFYYSKGKFHECPNCKTKLVPAYNFEKIGLLDKVTIYLFVLAVIAGIYASYFWGYFNAGALAFSIPALAASVSHLMYRFSLTEADTELQKTRAFVNNKN